MNDTQQTNQLEKPDEWLVEALRGEDPQEIDKAMQALQTRYERLVRSYAVRMVRWHRWVDPDDIVQETFAGFYKYIRGYKVKESVKALVMRIAHNKCVDALDRQEKERQIEYDIPLIGQMDGEEFIEEKETDDFIDRLPFTSPLSECQRVIYALEEVFDYPPLAVARLMGKSRQTIDTHFSKAKKRVIKYHKSKDYDLDLASLEWPVTAHPRAAHRPSLVVERFAEHISPHFTPEEVEPLGLTVEDFQADYVASLMLPWEPHHWGEVGGPSLVLTRRTESERLQEMFNDLHKNRGNTDQISPEECLLKVDLDSDHEHFLLTVEQIVEFLPEPEEWAGSPLSENTYLSIHLPRMTIPVTLGFFDRSLYTAELFERWPFLTEDAGL